jgi:hypothetical protein
MFSLTVGLAESRSRCWATSPLNGARHLAPPLPVSRAATTWRATVPSSSWCLPCHCQRSPHHTASPTVYPHLEPSLTPRKLLSVRSPPHTVCAAYPSRYLRWEAGVVFAVRRTNWPRWLPCWSSSSPGRPRRALPHQLCPPMLHADLKSVSNPCRSPLCATGVALADGIAERRRVPSSRAATRLPLAARMFWPTEQVAGRFGPIGVKPFPFSKIQLIQSKYCSELQIFIEIRI